MVEDKMDYNEMMRQLEIIFENQIQQGYKSFYTYRPKSKSVRQSEIMIPDEYITYQDIEISKDPEEYMVENENLELLITLCERIKKNSYLIKQFGYFFDNIISGRDDIPSFKRYKNANYLAFFMFYKMKKLEHALYIFTSYFDINSTSTTCILLTIEDILLYDYSRIEDNHLDKMKKYFHRNLPDIFTLPLKEYFEVEKALLPLIFNLPGSLPIGKGVESLNKALIRIIVKLITDIQFSRLQKLYKETDAEIKEHQEIVEKQIVDFGMPKEISEALAWYRRKYDAISDDEFEISSAIGELREIWSNYREGMSLKIYEKAGTEIPKLNDGRQDYLKYITDSLDLKNEKQLIGGLRRILNSEGSHALASEKLYFKLTLNILIEIVYLINEKYKNWEKDRIDRQ